jgi:pyruvate/2-oxoglutarate dehydrogenase complex dihydrolipoamide acyltransferase (E2) component
MSINLPDFGLDRNQPLLLSVWFAMPGDFIEEGDRLAEVLTVGATFDVPAPASGRLATIVAYPDDRLKPGQVLGWLERERTWENEA